MSKIRKAPLPADNFTIIRNDWLRDTRLSLKARGLLALLSSHEIGFETSIRLLAKQGPDGRDAIATAVRELEEYGYLTRSQDRSEQGTVGSSVWELRDPHVSGGKSASTVAGFSGDGSSGHGESGHIRRTTTRRTTQEDTATDVAVRPRRESATRLPEDWMPSAEDVAAIREQCPGLDMRREHLSFVDYWIAKPGAQAKKLDWHATWRNWMRRAADNQRGRPVQQTRKLSRVEENIAEYHRLFGGPQDEQAGGVPALDAGFGQGRANGNGAGRRDLGQ